MAITKLKWGPSRGGIVRSKCGGFVLRRRVRGTFSSWRVADTRFVDPNDRDAVGKFVYREDVLAQAKAHAQRVVDRGPVYPRFEVGSTPDGRITRWNERIGLFQSCPVCDSDLVRCPKPRDLLPDDVYVFACGGAYRSVDPKGTFVEGGRFTPDHILYEWSGECPRLARAALLGLPAWTAVSILRDGMIDRGLLTDDDL